MEVYSNSEITVNFAGITISAGALDQGDTITIEQSGPTYQVRKGNGGGASRARLYPSYTVKVKVRQTSSENGLLSALHNLDKATPGGAGIAPLLIADRLGTQKLVDPEAFIEGDPKIAYGQEEQGLEWTFICPNPTAYVGSH